MGGIPADGAGPPGGATGTSSSAVKSIVAACSGLASCCSITATRARDDVADCSVRWQCFGGGVPARHKRRRGTVCLLPLATEVSDVQNRVVRSRAVVYASLDARLPGEQSATAECQRYARSSEGAANARCKALSSTHYHGTITPRVRLAHQQVLQQRFRDSHKSSTPSTRHKSRCHAPQ